MSTVIIASFGLLIVVAVIVGLVMLVRALPPGSGPKVALAVAGFIAFGLLFMMVGYQRMNVSAPQPTVMQGDLPRARVAVPAPLAPMIEVRTQPGFSLLPWLIVVAVIVGLVVLFRSVPPSSRPKIALGLGIVLALMCAVFFVSLSQPVLQTADVRQEPPEPRSIRHSNNHDDHSIDDVARARVNLPPPIIDIRNEPKRDPTTSEASVKEPEPKSLKPAASDSQPNAKPAWLTQGLQTGNGLTQFPVSSELFATVAECRRDLDERMTALITSEIQRLFGEDAAIVLRPGEAQQFIADTYSEENQTTSQGTWYKVHRLIKIDETARAMLRTRYQEAQLQARLVSLGIGLGGVLLVLGVVYLFLCRKPRLVDPTLNTFSTT